MRPRTCRAAVRGGRGSLAAVARKRIATGVVALLAAGLAACGHKEKAVVVGDPTAEVLAYVPADADAVLLVRTDARRGPGAALARLGRRAPGVALVAGQVQATLAAGLGVDAAALRPLLAHPAVAWSTEPAGRLRFAAAVASDTGRLDRLLDDERQRGALKDAGEVDGFALATRPGGSALARKGPIVVAGPDLPALRGVLARRRAGRGQWTRGLLAERRLGLPGDGVAELLTGTRPVRARLDPRVPWVAALRGAAFSLRAEPGGLRLRARLVTDPALAAADVPIAGGAAPPAPRGSGRLVVAVRDPQHLLAFLRRTTDLLAPHALDGLRTVEELLGRYAAVSLQDDVIEHLTGTITLSAQDLSTATARSDLDDPGEVDGILGRFGTLARLGGPLAGLAGVDLMGYGVDERDGAEVVTRDGRDVVALAVAQGALVASTTPGADLGAAAAAPAPTQALPAEGAVRANVAAPLWQDELIRRLGLPTLARGPLAAFGPLTLTARGERTGLDVQLVVPVGG
jgi:hypothetical protein